MFKCQHTGKMIGPNVPENRIVTERRRKLYERVIKRGYNRGNVETVEGWEIVKEISVGPEAYIQLTGKTPAAKRVQEAFIKVEEESRPRHSRNRKRNNKTPKVQVVNPVKFVNNS